MARKMIQCRLAREGNQITDWIPADFAKKGVSLMNKDGTWWKVVAVYEDTVKEVE